MKKLVKCDLRRIKTSVNMTEQHRMLESGYWHDIYFFALLLSFLRIWCLPFTRRCGSLSCNSARSQNHFFSMWLLVYVDSQKCCGCKRDGFSFQNISFTIRMNKPRSQFEQEKHRALLLCTICEKSYFIVMRFFTAERTCFCLLCALCKSLSYFTCAFSSSCFSWQNVLCAFQIYSKISNLIPHYDSRWDWASDAFCALNIRSRRFRYGTLNFIMAQDDFYAAQKW